MKTIEQEIRERLAAENLSPENVERCMTWIKADANCRAIHTYLSQDVTMICHPDFMVSIWKCCWNSARDWMVAQLTAPVKREGELDGKNG